MKKHKHVSHLSLSPCCRSRAHIVSQWFEGKTLLMQSKLTRLSEETSIKWALTKVINPDLWHGLSSYYSSVKTRAWFERFGMLWNHHLRSNNLSSTYFAKSWKPACARDECESSLSMICGDLCPDNRKRWQSNARVFTTYREFKAACWSISGNAPLAHWRGVARS